MTVSTISKLMTDVEDEEPVTVGAHDEDRKSFVVICNGTSKLNEDEVYFLHSWIFEVWHKSYPRTNQFVIKDKKSRMNHLVPFERIEEKAIRNASSKPGKEWAIRLSDVLPEPEKKTEDMDFGE